MLAAEKKKNIVALKGIAWCGGLLRNCAKVYYLVGDPMQCLWSKHGLGQTQDFCNEEGPQLCKIGNIKCDCDRITIIC